MRIDKILQAVHLNLQVYPFANFIPLIPQNNEG